ncbi:MAG: GDSL-type esterase/lipase family protein [Victivallaceae bacterium]|nr:GDSL-type esterase/lipase family protein [Victivallaceae bacterium]
MRKLFSLGISLAFLCGGCAFFGKKQASEKPLRRIVCFGDSITAAGDFAGELQLYLSCKYPGERIEVFNAGVPGDTARVGALRTASQVLTLAPDMVIVGFGMNDVGRQLYYTRLPENAADAKARTICADNYRKNLANIIRTLRKNDIRVVLLKPFPYDENGTRPAPDDKIGFCNRIGLAHLAFLCETDYRGELPMPETREALETLYAGHPELAIAPDRIHPDKRGHWVIADEIVKTLFDGDDGDAPLPFPLTREMAEFSHIRPLPHLTRGGRMDSPAQILRAKLEKIRACDEKLILLNMFDSFALDKGLSPDDEEAVKRVVGDFARRFKMDEKYARYLQYREKRAEFSAASQAARDEYFATLKTLR